MLAAVESFWSEHEWAFASQLKYNVLCYGVVMCSKSKTNPFAAECFLVLAGTVSYEGKPLTFEVSNNN